MSIQSNVNQVISIAGLLGRRGQQFEQEQIKQRRAAEELKARASLVKEQTRQRKTRRNFLQYMQDEPTNLGVKFGQLPISAQKELAKEYTPSQRRTIMNRKDEMKK